MRKIALILACFFLLAQSVWPIEKQYVKGKLISVERKTRDRVDLYLVNTPVTTPVPYFEITVGAGSVEYVAEYTPRHSEEQLPANWTAGSDISLRIEKHFLFLKRSDDSEMKWIITKHRTVSNR